MADILRILLKDTAVINFLKKNEAVIKDYFHVPDDVSPQTYILNLSNEVGKSTTCALNKYTISPVYATTKQACVFCRSKLVYEKTLHVAFYDDVLGTQKAAVLTRYCGPCKITYYPAFSEDYSTKIRVFDDNWEKCGIFLSTYRTACSLDFLERSVCLKLKCHTAFMGRAAAYNLQHRYANKDVKKLSCIEKIYFSS